MKAEYKKMTAVSVVCILLFAVWTVLVKTVDVRAAGVNSTDIGLATLNTSFHSLTGVDMLIYNITDWLGLVPIAVCMSFGVLGLLQLIKRKRFSEVDADIIILGIYYIIVILCYLAFEMIPINYRPILINGYMESSYPSSTTLLVLSVMPTLKFQLNRRMKNKTLKNFIAVITTLFCLFTVVGRLVSGVHWLTDIVGSLLLSTGLFYGYKAGCVIVTGE